MAGYRTLCRLLTLSGLLMLVACTGHKTNDLESYVADIKGQQQSSIEPLPDFQPYDSFIYEANDLRDPFTQTVYSRAPAALTPAGGSGIKPDFDRAAEPLEEFALDSLRMVGTMERDEEYWALILATDDAIHRVRPGNYLGQNHGKITQITEYQVELTEIIPDGLGGWMERQASIAISE